MKKILHIIPSAFDYFSDIRERAFMLVEGLDSLGWHNNVITLQYGAPTRNEQWKLKQAAPSRAYSGESSLQIVEDVDFNNCDLLHVHVPFLGAARSLLQWKEKNPDKPLVVSYYHDLKVTDIFSFFFRVYNLYYLPRLFKIAGAVTIFPDTVLGERINRRLHQVEDRVIFLNGGKDEGKEVVLKDIVRDLNMLYNNLIH